MRRFLFAIQLPVALMVLYLDILTIAALFRRRPPAPTLRLARFAVLVPAHDEEALLPRLLESLDGLDYPRAMYEVHVVADNCSDRTVEVATTAGVQVHERRDERNRGKGHALKWLLEHLHEDGVRCDAYLIVDADSVVSANLLSAMNRHLARGDCIIQCYYGVANGDDSWPSALRSASYALFNGLRPRGRDALGLSAGLHGNGMCFAADVLHEVGWDAFTLAEDVELHLTLVREGMWVRYCPETRVLGEMPTSLSAARSQNVRWERGRLQIMLAQGSGLLAQAVRGRNLRCIEAIGDQVIPPLSVLTALTTLLWGLTAVCRLRGPRRLAASVMLGQVAHVITGLWIAGAERRVYIALLRAPIYIGWKVWIYCIAAIRVNDGEWIRTTRSQFTK